jgi:NodT family efflux transporter outer membrane factor (OMF) lipoprotein
MLRRVAAVAIATSNHMRIILNSVSLVVLALATAGCSTSPPVAMKTGELPKAYTAPMVAGAQKELSTEWWKSFDSLELTSLTETARTDNLDLAVAAARVLQAQAQAGLATSALFPSVGLNASAKRQGSKSPNVTFKTFGAGLGASYELDFWGLAQDNMRAARNSARAAIYAREVVALTTSANVANTYFAVLSLRERVAISKRNIEAAKRILAITQAKVTNGVSSNLELAQQTAILAGVEAQIPALEEAEREARYSLAILLGRVPEGFDVKGDSLEGIMAPPVEPGIPSTLLQRRPDIAQAEAQLFAAHADLDAARAAFLPAIGLTGNGGYNGAQISNLINPSNLAWSIGASLLQSIFDGGRLTSQRDYAKAREIELVATYRGAVLNALADVETALGSESSLAERERLTQEQVDNAAEAFRISELQYREGVVDLLTVLQAQQTLFSSQDTLVQVKLARLQAGVGLYRALGGGWTVAMEADTPTRNTFMPVPDFTDLPIGNPF